MNHKDKIIKSALTSVLALTLINTATAAHEAKMEKCYGIVKAGMNDCQTSTASCASSATKDRQGDAFLFVPEGTCNKISGGSTVPKKDA